jgi:hypothetical protein
VNFLDQKSIKLSFKNTKINGIAILSLTKAILLNNEKLYFVKMGPNFVGLAVIRRMIMKNQGPLINKHKNLN